MKFKEITIRTPSKKINGYNLIILSCTHLYKISNDINYWQHTFYLKGLSTINFSCTLIKFVQQAFNFMAVDILISFLYNIFASP